MSRQKTRKFEQNKLRKNIIEPGKPMFEKIKGAWRTEHFKNDNPISLELACGRGEYTVGLSRLFPDRNFIGVDIKGDRIWKGSGIAEMEGLENAAFLRTIIQQIEDFFAAGEVDEIWIMFPDPRPKDRDERRRLTYSRFLELYKNILSKDGYVRLKTDNTGFYEYTLETVQARDDVRDLEYTNDLYNSDYRHECHDIITRYEEKFHSKTNSIKYLKFRFS